MCRKAWLLLVAALLPLTRGSSAAVGVTDLTQSNFTSVLTSLPGPALILAEFYASWCPACRHFKPEYEKVGRFLSVRTAGAHRVHVVRADCATELELCDKFKVSSFPSIYLGRAADMARANTEALKRWDGQTRTAAGVVAWIAAQQQMSLTYEEVPDADAAAAEAARRKSMLQSGGRASQTLKWTEADVVGASDMMFTSITGQASLLQGGVKRAALQLLLQVVGAAHPVARCREAARDGLTALQQLWPGDTEKPRAPLTNLGVCSTTTSLLKGAAAKGGDSSSSAAALAVAAAAGAAAGAGGGSSGGSSGGGPWVACRGSTPDSRGFTCGLWLLFHAMSVRVPEADGGALLVSALTGWAENFFQCEVCQRHFVKVVQDSAAKAVRSRQDVVLWLWAVHNEVNARLERVETKYGHSSSGDPAFPKLQWPPVSICPACRDSSSSSIRTASKQSSVNSSQAQQQQEGAEQQQQPRWKEQQVLQFLEAWYANPASGAGPLWAALQGGNTGLARPLLLGKDTGLGVGEVAPSRGGMAPGGQLVLLAAVVMVFGLGWSWYKRRQVTSVRPRHYVGIVGHGGRLQSGPAGKYATNGVSRW